MRGRSAWQRRALFTQSVPILAAINSVNEAPDALNDQGLPNSSGSLAMFTVILLASTVRAVNIDTGHVVGNSHTNNNSGCSIGTETPTHRYEHNLNRRRSKIPAKVSQLCSGLGGGERGPCAFLRLTFVQILEWLYSRSKAVHSQAV